MRVSRAARLHSVCLALQRRQVLGCRERPPSESGPQTWRGRWAACQAWRLPPRPALCDGAVVPPTPGVGEDSRTPTPSGHLGSLAALVALGPPHSAPVCRPCSNPGTWTGGAVTPASSPHPSGPSREECIHCAPNFLFQDWRCVPACSEGFFPEDSPGLPHRVCRRYTPRQPPSAPGAQSLPQGTGTGAPPHRRGGHSG